MFSVDISLISVGGKPFTVHSTTEFEAICLMLAVYRSLAKKVSLSDISVQVHKNKSLIALVNNGVYHRFTRQGVIYSNLLRPLSLAKAG